jgi:hypothetical protein
MKKLCKNCNYEFEDLTKNKSKIYCCRKCNLQYNNKNYPNSKKGRYNTAKKECTRNRNVKKDNKQFNISFEDYTELTRENKCFYCEGTLNKYGTGLDRINSSKPYSYDNCVPCCKNCNTIKSNLLTIEETKEIIQLLKFKRIRS